MKAVTKYFKKRQICSCLEIDISWKEHLAMERKDQREKQTFDLKKHIATQVDHYTSISIICFPLRS
jgi:hypothetical protein